MTKITESEFHMWRTLFAVAHADGVVTNQEIRFMVEALEDVPFTEAQRLILTQDIAEAKDIETMFKGVTDPRDQARFFKFAHDMVWADGDYGKAEQDIMIKLQKAHMQHVDVEDLIGKTDLEFESASPFPAKKIEKKEGGFVRSFRDRFFKGR